MRQGNGMPPIKQQHQINIIAKKQNKHQENNRYFSHLTSAQLKK